MVKQIAYIIFGVLYTTIGVLILWTKWFIIDLQKTPSLLLGILFIVYGLFRIYRAVSAIRDENQ
ncbi:MAG: C4-dicarboxylate ABC transporter [Weeksellaceae bacterium]